MSSHRTRVQREANAIDLEMHRLVGRLHALADLVHPGKVSLALHGHAAVVSGRRSDVRQLMHPDDREATR